MPRKMLRLRQLGRLLTRMGVIDVNGRNDSGATARCFGHAAAVADIFEDGVESFLRL